MFYGIIRKRYDADEKDIIKDTLKNHLELKSKDKICDYDLFLYSNLGNSQDETYIVFIIISPIVSKLTGKEIKLEAYEITVEDGDVFVTLKEE